MKIKISGAETLMQNENGFFTKRSDIFISDGIIAGVGEAPEGFLPDRTLDGAKRLAIPGLINTHTHAYMSLFRNIADDLEFNDWLFGRILPLEDKLNDEDVYWGTMLGALEMISTGTTSYIDMTINMKPSLSAARDSGLRARVSRGLVGEGNNEGGAVRLSETLSALGEQTELVKVILGPHAPYTCDSEYLKIVVEAARKHNLPITIHLSESLKEIEDIRRIYGCSPIELMEQIGMLDVPTVAAHCVQLSRRDIEILAKKRVVVASNPISNAKLANGFAPLPELKAAGAVVSVGTDSAASNNTLNMFSDINFAALAHKARLHDALAVSANDALGFVFGGGAAAMGERVGRIAAGYAADIVLLNTDAPQFYPRNDYAAALCYSANGSEVETVIAGGKILMENKEFKALDKEKIYYECQKRIERIR